MRSYAIKQGLFDPKTKTHHSATVYNDGFDRQVDFGMRNDLKTKTNQILESWLSGFIAQQIKSTLKIMLFCKDKSVLVDRITNRDNITTKEAKHHIFDRKKKNTDKWKRMYKNEWQKWVIKPGTINKSKPIWFWYPELFDLTIDTYKYSKQETLKLALEKLGKKPPIVVDPSIFKTS